MAHSLKFEHSGDMTDIVCIECGRHWRIVTSAFERIFAAHERIFAAQTHDKFSDIIHEHGKIWEVSVRENLFTMPHSLRFEHSGDMVDVLCLDCGRHRRVGATALARVFEAKTHDLKSSEECHRRFSDWLHGEIWFTKGHPLKIEHSGDTTDVLCLECGGHWRLTTKS